MDRVEDTSASRLKADLRRTEPRLEKVRLYCFTAGALLGARDPLEVVAAQIEGGADVIQLREKQMGKRGRLELGLKIRELTRRAGVLFIVNDDVDLALILEADGVHLGQGDIPIECARPLMKGRIIGISTHSLDQVRQAVASGADYIGVGPVFSTRTKADAEPVVGLGLLRQVKEICPVPYVAIGGITAENIGSLVQAECRRAAVVSDVLLAGDVAAQCRRIKRILSGPHGTSL